MRVLARTGAGADDMMVQPSLGRFASATNPALTKEGFLMAEEWRPVIGYEGWYSVSSLGRVRRDADIHNRWGRCPQSSGRILKRGTSSKAEYPQVRLSRPGRVEVRRVHVLVARAFLGAPPNGHEVDHKDANRWNCALTNLEYVTHRENLRRRRPQSGSFSLREVGPLGR